VKYWSKYSNKQPV